jgi:hypothetical protein
MSATPEPPQVSTEVEIWTGVTIDLDSAVSPTELQPGVLTSSNVEPDFSVAEAAGDVSVIFTTSNPLPADGKIVITFPSGFRLNSGSDTVMGDDGASFDGTTSVAVSGQIATITRAGDGDSIDADQPVTLELSNIENPSTSGLAGIYSIRTTTALDVSIDEDPEVAPDTFIVGTLSGTNVQPASLVAGAVGDVGATFIISDPLPADGKVVITFPSGFRLNSGSATAMGDDGASFDGTIAVSVSGQSATITRGGDGDSVDADTVVTLMLTSIKNPPVSGSSKSYIIKTTTSLDTTLDVDTAVKPDIITPGVLGLTEVEPASLFAKAVGPVSVSFTTANPFPGDGHIAITFPLGFGLIGGEVMSLAGDGPSFDGRTTVALSEHSVIISRLEGSLVGADTKVFLVLNGIKNPPVSGPTGTYSVKTKTSAGVTIDQATSVSSDIMFEEVIPKPTENPLPDSSKRDSKSDVRPSTEAASEDTESMRAPLAQAGSDDRASIRASLVGAALAKAAAEDPESIGAALAKAAAEDPESIGAALAKAAAEDPESIGAALAEAASNDPESIGAALAEAASNDPESIGAALAKAAAEDPESIGAALAKAAAEDPESIGAALAEAAAEDPESIGAAIIFAREIDEHALGRALREGRARNPEAFEATDSVLPQEDPGSVIWVIVGIAGGTGLAIFAILLLVLNRNRKKRKKQNSRLTDDTDGGRDYRG